MKGYVRRVWEFTYIADRECLDGPEKFPEQYPATVDEWADPVETDNAEMASLRPLLKNTNLEFRSLRLTYSANRDGWNAEAFHKKVDRQGAGTSQGSFSWIRECSANQCPHKNQILLQYFN